MNISRSVSPLAAVLRWMLCPCCSRKRSFVREGKNTRCIPYTAYPGHFEEGASASDVHAWRFPPTIYAQATWTSTRSAGIPILPVEIRHVQGAGKVGSDRGRRAMALLLYRFFISSGVGNEACVPNLPTPSCAGVSKPLPGVVYHGVNKAYLHDMKEVGFLTAPAGTDVVL